MKTSSYTTALMLGLVLTQLGATDCGHGVLRDPGFDLWCGDALCAWKLERGEVRRVATWHASDGGVELVGGDAAIEQFSPVDSQDGTCLRFDLVADVAETAQVELAVDVYGDGTAERVFHVPTARWQPVSFVFAVAPPFTGIRFELSSHGSGRAALARLHAEVVPGGCDGVEPLRAGPAPLGALCEADGQCASGICLRPVEPWPGQCAGCELGAPEACGPGEVCGLDDPGPPERAVPIACVPVRARALGERCLADEECATGACEAGACSACGRALACPRDACETAAGAFAPKLCGPGLGHGASGAPCANGADCASGACDGAPRRQCDDGRACATAANCPVDAQLRPGACTTTGVLGGRCR